MSEHDNETYAQKLAELAKLARELAEEAASREHDELARTLVAAADEAEAIES